MATSSSTSSISSPATLGVSNYSSDFQAVLTRAVSIAQLPITALQNSDANILQEETQLSTLGTAVTNFQNSLSALGKLAQNKALVASSTDSSVVSVQASNPTSAASYTISNITSIAAAASETTQSGYADNTTPVSSTGTVKLVIGSNSYTINLTAGNNNLTGLRDAINNLGAGVTATVLTTGTGQNPNYLSITANNTGATTLKLIDDPTGAATNLLTSNNQGADAIFKLNGVSVDQPGNTINSVVPGLTFTIQQKTTQGQTVTLSLASDPTQLQGALQSFVDSYNALESAISAQVGKNAGLLSGNFIVRQIQSDLRSVTAYQGSGAIQSLSDLGIEIDQSGKATLNTSTLNSLSSSQVTAAFSFLGSTTTGLGGFSQQFTQLTDPYTGLIKNQQDSYQKSDQRLQSQISDLNTRVSILQQNLLSQLQAADALQAKLQSQQSELSSTIQSLNYTAFGASPSTSNTVG